MTAHHNPVIPAKAGIHFDFDGGAKSKMDPGFTRATRSPFGPAPLFARSARSRRDDAGDGLRGNDDERGRVVMASSLLMELRPGRRVRAMNVRVARDARAPHEPLVRMRAARERL